MQEVEAAQGWASFLCLFRTATTSQGLSVTKHGSQDVSWLLRACGNHEGSVPESHACILVGASHRRLL